MAPAVCQKMVNVVNDFLSKSSELCVVIGSPDFVQISPACGKNTKKV